MEQSMNFQALAETIPHLVWSARADGAPDYWNARLLSYLDRTIEEMQGWAWIETLHPDDRQRSIDAWTEAVTNGTELRNEYRMRRGMDGQYRWHAASAAPLRDAAGKIVRWFGTCTDIDERKQMEERLRDSEIKLRALHETNMDAFVCVDMTGRIIEFNTAYQALLGYTADELRSKTYVDLTPAKWHDVEARIVTEQIIPYGYSDVYEKEYLRKDGTLVPIELRTSLVRSVDGGPVLMWATIRDITERKKMKEQYRRFASLTSDYVHFCTRTGEAPFRVQWIDGAINAISGFSTKDILEQGCFLPMVHPDDRRVVDAYLLSLVPGDRKSIEFRIVTKEREVRWVSEKSQCEAGLSAGELNLYGAVTDITERKCIEEALQKSEARYRAIVESQTEFVTRFLPGGIFTYTNQALAKWQKRKAEDLIGKSFYPYIHESDREETIRKIEALSVADPLVTVEERVVSPDGKLCWHQWTNYAFFDEEGHILEYQAVGRDVTEKKEAEIYLAKAKETLEHEVRERTAALTLTNEQLTHEIDERKRIEQHLVDYQHKLEEMSLELSLATDRERGRIAEELHDDVGQRLILSRIKLDALANQLSGSDHEMAVNAIQELIDKILNDIRSMTFQLRPPILAGAGLVAAVQWLVEDLKEKYGLRIEVEYDTTPINLAYETKSSIFQVVRELLLNVAKHANTDRAIISVTTGANTLNVTVTDYGIGFDAATANKKIGRTGGFGIFSIKQRIEHLGGTLTLESKPGEGSRAIITVPLRSKDEQEPL